MSMDATMAVCVEVFYIPADNFRQSAEWVAMPVDEDERQVGDASYHRLKRDAVSAARKYSLPIKLYTIKDEYLKTIE